MNDSLHDRTTDLEAEIARLQARLEIERSTPLGKYAFYHRHRALAYVRQRDPALHQEATNAALREIERDGGRSFEDVVAALEAEVAALRAALADAIALLPGGTPNDLDARTYAIVAACDAAIAGRYGRVTKEQNDDK